MRRVGAQQAEDLVAHRGRAALVGIEAEHPVVPAGLDRAVAQLAEADERHLHHAGAERLRELGGAVGAVESTTTTSSAHSTVPTAASILAASL